MREIIFRGRRVDNGEWVYGDLVNGCEGQYAYIVERGNKELCRNYVSVDPETVGQFTGLTDKNGVKIFEGDVVRNGYSSNLGEFWSFGNVLYVVNDGCFEICNVGERYLKRLTQSQIVLRSIEVVGNIHDLIGG